MKLRALRKRRAKVDVLRIFVKIGEDNLAAAERFLLAVDDDIQKLQEMPGMGAKRNFRSRKLKDLRSWPVTSFRNYLIFYRVIGTELHVIRVLHGARNLEKALLE